MKKDMIYFDRVSDQDFIELIRDNSQLLDYFQKDVILRWKKTLEQDYVKGVDKAKFISYIPDAKFMYDLFGFLTEV